MLLLEDKIAKIVDLLDIPSQMGCYEVDDYSQQVDDIDYDLVCTHKLNVSVYHGVSKMAIVPNDSKYVVKVPFNGSWYTEEYYDEDTDTYEYSEEASFKEFWNANDIDADGANHWDYCENELIKYERAADAGFEMFLAETRFYGYKENHPIYLQEKVIEFFNYRSRRSASDDSRKKASSLDCCVTPDWLALAIDWYGYEKVKDFFKFAKEQKMDRDLHGGNIGFTENGRPVLLDWAGWRD